MMSRLMSMTLFRKLLVFAAFLTFDLIMFGAFVRITDAGLGCPDWPGCYGQITPIGAINEIKAETALRPDGPVTVFKAWVEMLHR
jgi:cytochrome c oxidase assembly protein subunit 15